MQFLVSLLVSSGILLQYLSNGLAVVLLPNPTDPVVAVQAWVGVGSADDPRERSGLSHVMEHLLFRGVNDIQGGESVAGQIQATGGDVNAWTGRDNTVLHAVMPSHHAKQCLPALAHALKYPRFNASVLAREKDVILAEMRMGKDEPAQQLAEMMFANTFDNHPYGRSVLGTHESVSRITHADVQEFHNHWYGARNLRLVVAGDFAVAPMLDTLEAVFSPIPTGALFHRPPALQSVPKQVTSILQSVNRQQTHLALTWKAPPLFSPDSASLDILATLLGQGESSILHRELVQNTALCTSAYAYMHNLRDHSLWVIAAQTATANITVLLSKLQQLFVSLPNSIDDLQLQKSQHTILADSIYQRETAQSIAAATGHYWSLGGAADFEQTYLQQVSNRTTKDIQDAAKRWLQPLQRERPQMATPQPARMQQPFAPTFAAKPAGPPPAAKPKPSIVHHTLANGLTLLVKPDSSVPLVAVRAIWAGGHHIESASESGIGELLATLLTRGCGARSATEIAEEVDASAATLVGFSHPYALGLRGEWLSKDWSRGLQRMAECLSDPSFLPREISRAKRQQMDQIRAHNNSPRHRALQLLRTTMYRANAPGTLGTLASVAKLDASAVQKHYKAHYKLANLTIAIVGDVQPEQVLERAEALFGPVPASAVAVPKYETAVFAEDKGPREHFIYMQREQSHLLVAYPGIAANDPDRFALAVLLQILGGKGGRLFVQLRDNLGLAYQIAADSTAGLEPGHIAITLACAHDKVSDCALGIQKEITRLLRDGMTEQELLRSKKYLQGRHTIALQKRSKVAAALGFHQVYGLPYDDHLHYGDRIEAITMADVQTVAKRIFARAPVTITVMPELASPNARRRLQGTVKRRKRRKSR